MVQFDKRFVSGHAFEGVPQNPQVMPALAAAVPTARASG
jgi:hypothetical protein